MGLKLVKYYPKIKWVLTVPGHEINAHENMMESKSVRQQLFFLLLLRIVSMALDFVGDSLKGHAHVLNNLSLTETGSGISLNANSLCVCRMKHC